MWVSLPRAVDSILMVAWKEKKDARALEIDNDGIYSGDRREVSENLDRIVTVALYMPSTEKL